MKQVNTQRAFLVIIIAAIAAGIAWTWHLYSIGQFGQ